MYLHQGRSKAISVSGSRLEISEDNEMKTRHTAIFLIVACLLPASTTAQDAHNKTVIGATKPGTIDAFGDKVVLVVAEWRGGFNKQNATNVFNGAVKNLRDRGRTCVESNAARQMTGDEVQKRTLAQDRHAVVGWHNLSTGGFIWFAIQRGNEPTWIRYVKCDENTTSIGNGWKVVNTETNGKRIRIQFADDDAGGVAWIFKVLN